MVPHAVGDVVDVELGKVVGEGALGAGRVGDAAAEPDEDAAGAPAGHEDEHAVGPLREALVRLQPTLSDVAEGAAGAGAGAGRERLHPVVRVARVRELEERPEVYARHLVGPAGRGGPVQVAAKVPAQPQLRHRDAGTLGRPLHGGSAGVGVVARRRLRPRVLVPRLRGNSVLPRRERRRCSRRVVGKLAAVEVEVVVVVPQIAVGHGGRPRRLAKTRERRRASVPRLGEIQREEVVVYPPRVSRSPQ